MAPIDRYRRLLAEPRAVPPHLLDASAPSAFTLWVFLQGYEYGDPGICDYLATADDEIIAKYRGPSGMSAAALLYGLLADDAQGYAQYAAHISAALTRAGADGPEPPGRPITEVVASGAPVCRSLVELVPALRAQASMVIGNHDVRHLRVFFAGLFRALSDVGVDVSPDRALLVRYEAYLQARTGLHGRWDRILTAETMGSGESVGLFVATFESFVATRSRSPAARDVARGA